MKRRICSFLIIALLAFPAVTASAESETDGGRDEFAGRFLADYITTFYNMDSNDFPSDEANAVLQTRDGYMWFGGYSGLTRYDGKGYTTWNAVSPNGPNSSNIRALYEDETGTLWIGTNDKGLVGLKNGVFTAYDKTMGAPSNTIRDIAGDTDGRIYCGTPEGLFYIDTEGNIITVKLDTEIQPFITTLSCDSQNNVYMVFNSSELFVYTADGRTVQYPSESQIWEAEIVSDNRLVAGTQDGDVLITEFDGNNFSRASVRHTSLANISDIYEDSNGYIWITSETGVGFLDTDGSYHNAGNPNGVGFYTDIWEDYQNGYWITGSKGGVVKLTASMFSDLNALYHFETGSANAVVIDGDRTYIGTDNGIFILDKNGKPILTDFTDPITARVRGIFRDSGGHIWICTYSDFGVIRYTPETDSYKSWLPEDGLVSDRARCMTELQNGVVVIGTGGGVSFIRGDDIISANEAFGTDKKIELPDITVLSLVCAADGTLYIGTDGNGVYAINKDGTTRYQEEDGLTGGVILRMSADRKTNGVFVSPSVGLCYIDDQKNVRVIDKIPPHTFLDVMQYENELILLTSSQIIRTDLDALLDPELPFEYSAVDKSSGLTASINANAWNMITEDGSLYFCCDSGIKISGFENKTAAIIPYAGISRIDVDGTEHTDFTGTITMPRDTRRLTIELSYLSFGLLDEAALYYILDGQDSEAQTLTKNDNLNISYTNLRGGNYTLRVWTEDSAGNKGNLIELGLQKELKLFEHAYMWGIAAVLAALLIFLLTAAVVRYKSRRHYEKQREYRTIISQALTAIANTIDAKDSYTSGHSARVAAYSAEIAQRMGMDKNFIENIYYIGLLHDVGKIGVPNAIINKPASLTDNEYDTMKQHARIGREILKGITTINNLTAGAAEHHERWDGTGYYQGIVGENISLEGRIIAAADTYDAMSSDRAYRDKLPKEVILEEFKSCCGSQFDPKIAAVVIEMIEQDYFNYVDVNKLIGINEGIAEETG